MAWIPASIPTGSVVLASETGVYYTDLGAGPGLLFPEPLLINIVAGFWTVTTNSPQTEDGRTWVLQGLRPEGWYDMTASFPEGSPYPLVNLTNLVFTAVRFKYTDANGCIYYSGNGTFIPPIVPPTDCTIIPNFSVSSAVDANMEGLTGDGYFFIATDQYAMGNAWASNVGSVVNVVGGVYTYTVVAEGQVVYAIDTQLYWRVIGGDPAPLFPPLTATQTGSPTGYFLESDWINASLSDNRLVTVQGSIDGAAAVILWQGPESDLPQQLFILGVLTDLTATYLVDGCAYEVDGTTVVPDTLAVDFNCSSELSYLFYRYNSQPDPGNTSWLFTNTEGFGNTITLTFIAGEQDIANVITFYDGPDDSYPPINFASGFTDLTGFSVQSTGEQMFMLITQSTDPMPSDFTTWWWQVGCTSGSTLPTATVIPEEKCDEYQLCLVVDVTALSDYPTINIQYAVDGGVPAIISDISTTGPVSLGCFDYQSEVVIVLVVTEDPLANVTLGAFTGSGSCDNPCLPAGASKIDGAGDLADLPAPPPMDGYRYLVTSDITGIGTWETGEVLGYNAGMWTLDTSVPGTYSTDEPLQYWTTTGPGGQVTPLLPIFYLTPTGTNPNNFTLFAPDVALYGIPTNEPFVLQIRTGTGPWNTVYTGTLQQVIVPLPIPVTAPFTNARVILNYLDCGLITGVVLDT